MTSDVQTHFQDWKLFVKYVCLFFVTHKSVWLLDVAGCGTAGQPVKCQFNSNFYDQALNFYKCEKKNCRLSLDILLHNLPLYT